MSITEKILSSWCCRNGNVNKTKDLITWVQKLNERTYVNIVEKSIYQDNFWFYDDYNGEILNRKRSFFSIKGMRRFDNENFISEQPVIIQPEIGYLGIICKEIDGMINFLMQAKIEPGNINCVQISPTIQATKSNFTRAHGGNLPAYFEMFENSLKHRVLYDQIQSEQASRFYKKRNRNMIMLVEEEIEVLPNFKWMTLGQIKELMKIDNLVNMDTRTVLSGIPFLWDTTDLKIVKKYISDNSLVESMNEKNIMVELPTVFQELNNYKMFSNIRMSTVPLYELVDWEINEYGMTCKKRVPFMVRFYEIEIEGREVRKWSQPLFKAIGMATFGLITTIVNGVRKYLVKINSEFGSFDKVEIGPSIQWESTHYLYDDDKIERIFRNHLETGKGVMTDVILSEEGGRFYHEQNRNVIIEIEKDEIKQLPKGYIWVSFSTINLMIQFYDVLNIQLRNLISIIDI
jgi:oxidase EvaA